MQMHYLFALIKRQACPLISLHTVPLQWEGVRGRGERMSVVFLLHFNQLSPVPSLRVPPPSGRVSRSIRLTPKDLGDLQDGGESQHQSQHQYQLRYFRWGTTLFGTI